MSKLIIPTFLIALFLLGYLVYDVWPRYEIKERIELIRYSEPFWRDYRFCKQTSPGHIIENCYCNGPTIYSEFKNGEWSYWKSGDYHCYIKEKVRIYK